MVFMAALVTVASFLVALAYDLKLAIQIRPRMQQIRLWSHEYHETRGARDEEAKARDDFVHKGMQPEGEDHRKSNRTDDADDENGCDIKLRAKLRMG
jgi:hypothetical protein